MKNTTKKKKTGWLLTIIVVLFLFLVFLLLFTKNMHRQDVVNKQESDYHSVVYQGENYTYNTSLVNILLLGIDTSDASMLGQADAIELLVLDRENERFKLMAISRDTMTDIRLFDVSGNDLGWQKQHLNLAYAYGKDAKTGCMYTIQAVSRMLFDIPVTRYAALDISMLKEVHNVVGDLEVVVPNDSLTDVDPMWQKGATITITSDNVETYLRTRDTDKNYSNEDRMQRQESYMKAYYQALKEKLEKDFDSTFSKMYNVLKSITTNISFSELQDFANMIVKYEFDSDKDILTLEGKNVLGELHDEFELDQKALRTLVLDEFYTKEE